MIAAAAAGVEVRRRAEGLRGYAALLMVVYHAWVLTGGPLLGGGRAVLSGGFLAVDLFFVLSAFVLLLPAARTGDVRLLADYALRRAARILPAYYAALAVALILFHAARRPRRRPPPADAGRRARAHDASCRSRRG